MQEASGDIWSTCLPAPYLARSSTRHLLLMARTRLAQPALQLSVTEPDYIKAITAKVGWTLGVNQCPAPRGCEGWVCGWGDMEEASCLTYTIWTLTGFWHTPFGLGQTHLSFTNMMNIFAKIWRWWFMLLLPMFEPETFLLCIKVKRTLMVFTLL